MKKVTKKTLKILAYWFSYGYRWLTQDEMSSRVFVHRIKPEKLSRCWYSRGSMMWIRKTDETQEIYTLCSWDDAEPVEIAILLKQNGMEVTENERRDT